MKYYLDTEFDGPQGPLISLALVREDCPIVLYLINQEYGRNGVTASEVVWVRDNVIPILYDIPKGTQCIEDTAFGGWLRAFLKFDDNIHIVADSMVDIYRFCKEMTQDSSGEYVSNPHKKITFTVDNVDTYPTDLPGAIQHNAVWDARALKHAIYIRDFM